MEPNPLPGGLPASRPIGIRGRILRFQGGHTMDERELAESLRRVREGSLDRRQFARTLLGLGLTAPMVVELLGPRPGRAQARRSAFTPTRRGGGGEMTTLSTPDP